MPVAISESQGIQNHQFEAGLDPLSWKRYAATVIDNPDQLHEIPVQVHHREIPAWTLSDSYLRFFLWDLYPRMKQDGRQRIRAAATCALIYRYFRMCEPASSIASDLCISLTAIQRRIERIKKRAAYLNL